MLAINGNRKMMHGTYDRKYKWLFLYRVSLSFCLLNTAAYGIQTLLPPRYPVAAAELRAQFKKIPCNVPFVFFISQQPLVGQGLILEASRSQSDTTLCWAPLDECSARHRTSTRLHTTLTKDRHVHAFGGIRTQIPRSERRQTHALDRATTGICYRACKCL